jgi:hypothetical protein
LGEGAAQQGVRWAGAGLCKAGLDPVGRAGLRTEAGCVVAGRLEGWPGVAAPGAEAKQGQGAVVQENVAGRGEDVEVGEAIVEAIAVDVVNQERWWDGVAESQLGQEAVGRPRPEATLDRVVSTLIGEGVCRRERAGCEADQGVTVAG